MLKYKNIIELLSTSQKIRMLCDIGCLSEKEYKVLGIPELRIGYVDEGYGAKYPSPYMLANSWNKGLVGRVAQKTAREMHSNGVTLAVTPGAKVKISPYRAALSEDPVLSSALAGEYIGAVRSIGLSACPNDFSLTSDEAEWMDKTPKSRIIYEYIVKPYRRLASSGGLNSLAVATDLQNEGYENVNGVLAEIASRDESMGHITPIFEKTNMLNTVSAIMRGVVCADGAAAALEAALSKYAQMKKSLESELISEREFDAEIESGRAVSPEMLDAAVDKLIGFAFTCERKKGLLPNSPESEQELALQATREAIVLLKNERKLLPINKKSNICLIGDIAMNGETGNFAFEFMGLLEKGGYKISGTEKGYCLEEERGEQELENAVELAKKADVAFVFLGFGKERERRIPETQKLSLPANQQVLLEKLGSTGCKIVAVIHSDFAADFVIDERLDAAFICPLDTSGSAQAFFEVASGKISPCGKLANSIYLNTDEGLKKQKVYKRRDGVKSGPFIGYRYYDTAGYCEGYAFGHGLSYVDFAYSGLAVKDGKVRVTVKNTGKMTACETVQIYIGMESSAVIRPKKELMAFEKAELAPGEKRTFYFPLEVPEVFDAEKEAFVTEKGTYTVYAGASALDIRLTCKTEAGEVKLKPDGETKCGYLQSESNIIEDNYKLEADCDIMKKSVLNIIAGAVSLFLAVVLKTYCSLENIDAMFFDVLAAFLVVCGWIFFVAEIISRRKDRKIDKERISSANESAFAEAEEISAANADALFTREFDVDTESEVLVSVEEESAEGFGAEHLVYVDRALNFEAAAEDFIKSAREKGYEFSENEAKKIFASMASSRLIVLHGMGDEEFKKLMVLMGNYFESSAYIDYADYGYTSSESLLFRSDASGARSKTNVKLAMEAAEGASEKVHFAGIMCVKNANLASYISPVVKYAKSPAVRNYFNAHNEKNIETPYSIPANLWFVINLASEEKISMLPGSVAEAATVGTVRFKECAASEVHINIRRFSYYQMEYLCEKIASRCDVDEALWKKLDRLEAYVAAKAEYHIGNTAWLCLERYVSVLISCGYTQIEAIDAAVAAKILPSMIMLLEGKLSSDGAAFSETVENIFGEDNASACKILIKTCGAGVL